MNKVLLSSVAELLMRRRARLQLQPSTTAALAGSVNWEGERIFCIQRAGVRGDDAKETAPQVEFSMNRNRLFADSDLDDRLGAGARAAAAAHAQASTIRAVLARSPPALHWR
jgi:hypothetical protein